MAFAGKRLPALKRGQRINPGLGRSFRLQGTSRTRARGENAESYPRRNVAAMPWGTVTYIANDGKTGGGMRDPVSGETAISREGHGIGTGTPDSVRCARAVFP